MLSCSFSTKSRTPPVVLIPSFSHLSRTMSLLKDNMIFKPSFAIMELNHLISLHMYLDSEKEVVKLSCLLTGFLRKKPFSSYRKLCCLQLQHTSKESPNPGTQFVLNEFRGSAAFFLFPLLLRKYPTVCHSQRLTCFAS